MKNKLLKQLNTAMPILACAIFFSTTAHAASSIEPRLKPGTENDTTADAVAGQLDFTHDTRNMIDSRGFDFSGSISDIVVDKTVSPQRLLTCKTALKTKLQLNPVLWMPISQ